MFSSKDYLSALIFISFNLNTNRIWSRLNIIIFQFDIVMHAHNSLINGPSVISTFATTFSKLLDR